MSKRPKRKGIRPLVNEINRLSALADKVKDQAAELEDDYPEEVWKHAASEIAKSLTVSCEATMDGGLLVEVIDNGDNIILKHGFSLVEVFELSTFSCGSDKARQDMIAAAKQVLAFAEQVKVQV